MEQFDIGGLRMAVMAGRGAGHFRHLLQSLISPSSTIGKHSTVCACHSGAGSHPGAKPMSSSQSPKRRPGAPPRRTAASMPAVRRRSGEAGFALDASRTAWPDNASRWRHGWPVRCRPTPAHCRPVCRSTTFAACSPTRPAVPAPSPGRAAAGPGRRSHCNDLSLTSSLPKVALGISQRSPDVQASNQHQLPRLTSKTGG